jgi:hypothetical protein
MQDVIAEEAAAAVFGGNKRRRVLNRLKAQRRSSSSPACEGQFAALPGGPRPIADHRHATIAPNCRPLPVRNHVLHRLVNLTGAKPDSPFRNTARRWEEWNGHCKASSVGLLGRILTSHGADGF